ncbi:hypothetical protein B0T18DRAFT_397554 [Schizothecium vesticola]|uniref:Uncharacterized protein n=1 Tax=Schizothecium vesticola TaxID=314040 RepID=A0AA40KCB0_9PEZI|nr:hypothetical protein B0T18DRAFT_397554 [Schizothecium vesticola]
MSAPAPTLETFATAQADVAHLLSIAKFPARFTVSQWGFTLPDPETNRNQRARLRWVAENFWLTSYRARTWGYTILRTTYADDAAFQRAVEALRLFVRAQLDADVHVVTQQLQQMHDFGKLPEGISATADPKPGDELYERFVVDVVEDQEGLEGTTGTDLCTHFKRWALERWDKDEAIFSAASPRLKTALVLDEETVAQLQGVKDSLENEGEMVWYEVGKRFWVKMVEAVPEERGGPRMNQGVVDVYCMQLVGIVNFYWDRDMRSPAYMSWKQEEGVPGGWMLNQL